VQVAQRLCQLNAPPQRVGVAVHLRWQHSSKLIIVSSSSSGGGGGSSSSTAAMRV
jgi:hypothetical protein